MRADVLLWCVLIGCACSEPAPAPSVSAGASAPAAETGCEVALSPEPGRLADAVERSAARWSTATGCDVHVADGGVPVVFEGPLLRPDGSEAPGVTSEARDFVRIDPRMRRHLDETVAHEIGHVLGAGHVDSLGLMSGHEGHENRIDVDSLAAVCAALPCVAFTPEAP